MAEQGTKDVSQAQVRTDINGKDTLLLVNAVTKEVQQVEVEKVAENATLAPAEFDDFFGL